MSALFADIQGGVGRRAVAVLALAVALSGGTGFALGHWRATGEVTRLTIATCGLGEAPAPVALPLRDLLRKAGGHNVSVGPFRHDGLDGSVTVRFAPGSDGPRRTRPDPDGDVIVLPVPASGAAMPDEIRLECRYGAIARVQYRTGPAREAFDLAPDRSTARSTAG